MSSSVTPPNSIPVFLFAHSDIVQPERSDGAYAVEGLLRLSHFIVGRSDEPEALPSSAVGIAILSESCDKFIPV